MSHQVLLPVYRVEETLNEIRECLETGWTGAGGKTIAFEDAWKQATGLPYAHFVNSATSGLLLAVQLLKARYGWRDGDEIITTPLTFVSTNHVILQSGLKPVFADVDATGCLDLDSIADRATGRTRAVMFVGLGGNTGQYNDVVAWCRKQGYRVILDAAHMAGTKQDGVQVGHEADVCIFSFHAVKNLPTADSGMICFADSELDAAVRQWAWLGINKDTYARSTAQGAYKWHYEVEHLGFKAHGNSLMATVGLVALRYLDQDNAYRRQLATWYDRELETLPVTRVPMTPGILPSRHLYQIRVARRDETMLALNQYGIYPGVHYRDNIQYPMYAYAEGTCPEARQMSHELMSLPLHLKVTEQDVKFIGNALREILCR